MQRPILIIFTLVPFQCHSLRVSELRTHPILHSPFWVVSRPSSPTRGYKSGCVCSCMAGLTPMWRYKFACVRSVSCRPTQTGLCKFGWFRAFWTNTPPERFLSCFYRRRTKVQQLTCNIGLSCSFYYLFFSFVLLELKPFVLKGKALGEKFWKSVKILKRFCPLVVAL